MFDPSRFAPQPLPISSQKGLQEWGSNRKQIPVLTWVLAAWSGNRYRLFSSAMVGCPGADPLPAPRQPNVRWEPNLEARSLEGRPFSPMARPITAPARGHLVECCQ